MRQTLLILLLILGFYGFSQTVETQKKVDWNGYTQLRATSNFSDNSSIMVRRLKFWIKSTPEFSEHWSYKVQALFASWMQERFFLQDVKINYKTGLFSFDMGQFVPQYSLQRFQRDVDIAAIERAAAINALIPNGTLGVRDVGIQINFHSSSNLLETHFGAFNGHGIKEYQFDNKGFMLTHKTSISIPVNKNQVQLGYSLMYRNTEDLQIKKVFPDSVLYTGTDVRYNIFAMFTSRYFGMQAEYLNANFEGEQANGYYFLATTKIRKSEIVLSFEDYKNTYSETHYPHYRLGYNYLINRNKTKLFFDNYFQIKNGTIKNYYASIQLQMFFK